MSFRLPTIVALSILFGWVVSAYGQEQKIPEKYELQIAYIYNLSEHVIPPGPRKPNPFIIGTLGKHPYQNGLNTLAARGLKDRRRILIRHCNRAEELSQCHLVYIGPGAAGVNFDQLHRNGIITVADKELVPKSGAMVEFFVFRKKGRFNLDNGKAKAGRLKFGAPLMQLLKRW